ncbi:MAG: hypothetical protein AAB932_00110 [Patescibacteria group bacterium]
MKKFFSYLGLMAGLLLVTGAGCLSLKSSNDPSTTGPAGMFVSPDRGETWGQIVSLPKAEGVSSLANVSVYRVIEDPQDPKAMYWLSRGEGFFFSYDEGETWQRPSGPLASGFVYSIAVDPTDKCTLYGTNGLLVYRSDDCSRSWTEVYRESRSDRVAAIAVNPFPPYELYVLKSGGDLLKSEDQGISWSVMQRFRQRVDHLIADHYQPGVLYIATRKNGMYRSVDMGETWEFLTEPISRFSGGTEYRRMFLHPTREGVIYWICTYGILVSEDSGETWRGMELITPPGSADIYAFAVNPTNDKEMYYTATVNYRSTFYKTVDGGENWITKKLPSGQVPTALRVHPEQEQVVYIGFTIPPPEKK